LRRKRYDSSLFRQLDPYDRTALLDAQLFALTRPLRDVDARPG
jgi:hypothetical protein